MSSDPQPRSGEDTYDLIDDALTALAQRRGVWLGDNLATIGLLTSLIEAAQRWLPQLVHDARANQHDWPEIAKALNTSPDQARPAIRPRLAHRRWQVALHLTLPTSNVSGTPRGPLGSVRDTNRAPHTQSKVCIKPGTLQCSMCRTGAGKSKARLPARSPCL
ncbi:MAG: hypothetical protein ACRDTJ_04520, partial [Pseudonocardiaceae bacterium]